VAWLNLLAQAEHDDPVHDWLHVQLQPVACVPDTLLA
jgi:hypothetical protein